MIVTVYTVELDKISLPKGVKLIPETEFEKKLLDHMFIAGAHNLLYCYRDNDSERNTTGMPLSFVLPVFAKWFQDRSNEYVEVDDMKSVKALEGIRQWGGDNNE